VSERALEVLDPTSTPPPNAAPTLPLTTLPFIWSSPALNYSPPHCLPHFSCGAEDGSGETLMLASNVCWRLASVIRVQELIDQAARSAPQFSIIGESGVGKE